LWKRGIVLIDHVNVGINPKQASRENEGSFFHTLN
jgi:hypothetical protein